jgi:hypothetical protein
MRFEGALAAKSALLILGYLLLTEVLEQHVVLLIGTQGSLQQLTSYPFEK